MVIKIVGINTIKGNKLKNKIIKLSYNIDKKIIINLENNSTATNLPILYINDRLISNGRIPSDKEILKNIKNNL